MKKYFIFIVFLINFSCSMANVQPEHKMCIFETTDLGEIVCWISKKDNIGYVLQKGSMDLDGWYALRPDYFKKMVDKIATCK